MTYLLPLAPDRPPLQFLPRLRSLHIPRQTGLSPLSPPAPHLQRPRQMHGLRFRLRPAVMDTFALLEPNLPTLLVIVIVS
jgi:hypothetical protein